MNWAELYDNYTFGAKKMITAQFVKAVRVKRGYEVDMGFHVSFEEFQKLYLEPETEEEKRTSDNSELEVVKLAMNKKIAKRVSAILLIILGIAFGSTWNSTGICLGDIAFSALGLPVWSKGTHGTHYPAIVGIGIILIGIAVLSPTLSKKTQLWVWSIVILILLILGLVLSISI